MGLTFLLFIIPSALAQQDSIRYDTHTGNYLFYQRDSIGQWSLRQILDREEYLSYRARKLGFTNFTFGKGTPSKPKSPAQLSLTTNGTLSANISQTRISDDNPALNSMMRRRNHLTLDLQSNISVVAKYGENLRLDLQYNTQTALDAKRTRLKLQYIGDEFDFIKRIELGNIRMDSYNPLIDAGRDLFGMMGVFKAGPLELKVLASRQYDNERKVMISGGQQVRYFDIKSSQYDYGKHFFLSEYFAQRYDQALATLPLISSTLHIDRVEVWVSSATQNVQRADTEPVEAFLQPSTQSASPPDNAMLIGDAASIPRAVKLPDNAYTLNPTLGYISLHAPLADDQMLAVVYTYHLDDREYQVGSFMNDDGAVKAALIADRSKTPEGPLWKLMMKNAYALGTIGIAPDDLTVDVLYRNPRTNTDEHTITTGEWSGQNWSSLFGWDVTNSSRTGDRPDGLFDFIEDATISSRSGTLFLPQREPFVTVPQKAGHPTYAILYSGSPTEAERASAEDRFVIRGSMRNSTSQIINLGSVQLMPGSVTARQGGRQLQEGIDFEVNYVSGDFTLRPQVQGDVEVTIREREIVRSKEKNVIGAEANFHITHELSVGATILNHTEQSHLNRIRLGEEPLNNLLWGLHANYQKSSSEWTDRLRKWTRLDLNEPTSLELHASYASLTSKYNTKDGQIILEDFEQSGMVLDLTFPRAWKLGSDPMKALSIPDPENHRALMSWYMIDPLLVRDGATNQPAHLRDDRMARAHPLVREVRMSELLPQRDQSPFLMNELPTLSISYYPNERGPYNTSTDDLHADGTLDRPKEKWGAMIRPLEIHDFEKERIAYLEGWILDPTAYDDTPNPGTLLIDLGQMSEEILPDTRLNAEGTMPMLETTFGKAPEELPQTYAFDRSGSTPMDRQDYGYNGLTSEEERTFPLYSKYLSAVESLSGYRPWEQSGTAKPGHPFYDPAGDDYHYFLGDEWDRLRAGILERYKYINGPEGNSLDRMIQGQQSAQTWEPDVEDLDRDFVLQDEEHFFRYILPISAEGLLVDGERVVAERILTHTMPDGSTMQSRWVKVRIPLHHPTSKQGNPMWQDIRSIRFTLTGFERPIHLRWAMFRLVGMPWSPFESAIDAQDTRTAQLSVSTIGVEEESAKEPIPYVTPPGVERNQLSSFTMTREDEKALALTVQRLDPGQAAAVYQTVKYDLRHYKELTLFSHLESSENLRYGAAELFVRLGSDFTDNYYEYSIPLQQTTKQDFKGLSKEQLKQLVWLPANQLRVPLELFTNLKHQRNNSGIETNELFQQPSPKNSAETIGIKGFPTLGDITGVMIGIRSRDRQPIAAEVWVNELSVSGAGSLGGDALLVSGKAVVSDLLTLEGDGGYRSAGFGPLQADARKSDQNNLHEYNIRGRLQMDKLLPTRWMLRAPISYTLSFRKATPKYDPLASDLLYDEKNSAFGGNLYRTERLSLTDWHVERQQDSRARFFALSNLRYSYDLQRTDEQSPEVTSRFLRLAHSTLNYSYEPAPGSYVRLNSDWNRQFILSQFGTKESQTGHSFSARWDWRRSLSLRWAPLRWMSLGLESATTALIHEPFEEEFIKHGTPKFRLLTDDILRSIFRLGETMNANSRTEMNLSLPKLSPKALAPLTANIAWRSNYTWTRGLTTANSFGGHRATNSGYFDARASYRFRELFRHQDKAPLQQLSLHFRHTYGSSMPSFLPAAGKAMGIGIFDHSMAPSLWYMLALGSNERHIRKAFEKSWFISPESAHFRRPSFYSRNEAEGLLTLTPLPGLQIDLTTQYFHNRMTTLYPAVGSDLSRQLTGTLRMSTIGLRHFFDQPLKAQGFHSKMFARLASKLDEDVAPPDAFLQSYALSDSSRDGLPRLSTMLPNWSISLDLAQAFPRLSKHAQRIVLKNGYRGYVEYPNYRVSTDVDGTVGRPQPSSIVQVDELSPLLGVETAFKFGLELEERYTQRRITTLLTSTARLMEQYETELYTSVRYRRAIPALFRSRIPLLQSAEHEVRFNLNHIYSRSYLLTSNLNTRFTAPSQGQDNHTLNASVEYGLSKSFSVRAFVEQEQHKPLVTNLTYPYRRTTYGVLLLLNLSQ